MKSTYIKGLCFGLSAVCAFQTMAESAQSEAHRVLMVLSSYGEKNADGEMIKPGYEFDELSKSYLVFKAAGSEVTFASPAGGNVVADKYNADKSYNQQFLADKQAVAALSDTVRLDTLKADTYDAVFVVGGKGPMFDLAQHEPLKQLIRHNYEQGSVISAVCHGPAALLDITLTGGAYLVEGKRISAFTNEEELAFTKKWTLPFLLEDKLKEQGARFVQDGLMLNQISVDGRIVTAQNPFSTADAAKAVMLQLGAAPDSMPEFRDDRTIKLAEAFYADEDAALATFNRHPDLYDPMLLAMLGVYQAKYASTEHELNVAISLMQHMQPKINHPMLDKSIAKAMIDKNQSDEAREHLTAAQAKFPDDEGISELLKELGE